MSHPLGKILIAGVILALCGAGIGLAINAEHHAPSTPPAVETIGQPAAYRIGDTSESASASGYPVTQASDVSQPPPDNASGPVRLVRFSDVQGTVDCRNNPNQGWAAADVNEPIREGAQIAVQGPGRAELQFDDGSLMRIGRNCDLALTALYSDNQGEFTQCKLTQGLTTLEAPHARSIYEIDTPMGTVRCSGPANVRVGVDPGLEVAVTSGQVVVQAQCGREQLHAGQYAYLPRASGPYEVSAPPSPDNWDRWNGARNHYYGDHYPSERHLPSNEALVSGNLDAYGDWHDDPHYGYVWHPHYSDPDWRPYYNGHWDWVDPVGWTWVSDEPWGWAPYHYGTWVDEPYGWAWVPGPANQCWAPAVVDFSYYNGNVCWAPLAPWEVRYPATLSIGLSFPNWSLFFSIGQAGVFYPYSGGYWAPTLFDPGYVNRVTYVNNITTINNYYNGTWGGRGIQYVPYNARMAPGATLAPVGAFAGGGAFRPLARGNVTPFARGVAPGPPAQGRAPFAGPRLPQTALPAVRTAMTQRMTRIARSPALAAGVPGAGRTASTAFRPGTAFRNGARMAALGAGAAALAARPGRTPGVRAVNPAARMAAMRARTALGMRPGSGATSRNRFAASAPNAANRRMAAARTGRTGAPALAHHPNVSRTPQRMAAAQRAANVRRAMSARPARMASRPSAAMAHRASRPAQIAARPAARTAARFHRAQAAPAHMAARRSAAAYAAHRAAAQRAANYNRTAYRRQTASRPAYNRPAYNRPANRQPAYRQAYQPRNTAPAFHRAPRNYGGGGGGYGAAPAPRRRYGGGGYGGGGYGAAPRRFGGYGGGGAPAGYRVREGGYGGFRSGGYAGGGGFRGGGGYAGSRGGGAPAGRRNRRGNGG